MLRGTSVEASDGEDGLIESVGKLLWVLDGKILFCVRCIGFGIYFDHNCLFFGRMFRSKRKDFL